MKNTNEEAAVKEFVDRIISNVYQSARKYSIEGLENNPDFLLTEDRTEALELHNWFSELSEKERKYIIAIIQSVVELTVFNFLVILDNKSGGYPVENRISDYALYLQTYKDRTSMSTNDFQEATRLNRSYDPGGDLHDYFSFLLGEKNIR